MTQLRTWILDLQQVVDTLPGPLQMLAVLLIGMIPFLEGDVAATIGVVAGIHWLPSIVLGVTGTVVVTFLVLSSLGRFGRSRDNRWAEHKVMRRVEQWGVPIGMLISGFLFSVPVTVFIMGAAGLRRPIVLISALAVAVLNGTVAGLVSAGILQWVIDI
ncbi:hypothetical protein ACFYE2_16370 [Kocuria sp. CPCC 205300]|uniref:hypothetical protein n=1 Tax=Kocuria sabuli TaxID=3071448 RepID=UPI0036DF90B2